VIDRIRNITDIHDIILSKYSLLIIDVNLAKENNAQVVRQIRNNNPLLPIIAIGTDNPKQEIISYQLEINLYHRKPINCELLKV
jgi:CheY-like chemotaxis protein